MTKKVVVVEPETSLMEAVNVLLKHSFTGLPVVDGGIVVGVITEYDMILKGSSIHLPTLLRLMNEIDIYKKNSDPIKNDIAKILNLKVRDVMNNDPLLLSEGASIMEVVNTFTEHHTVNPIPIINSAKQLVGIISRSDTLKFLGDKTLVFSKNMDAEEVNVNINKFLNNFDKKFVLVSRFRTKFWLLASVFFAVMGFIIAFAIIVRIR